MITLRQATPNLLTAASLVVGLCSVISAELGDLERAAWFIVWCALLDVADGPVARLLKANSEFGADFDSLADLVAFGLAPAALVLHLLWPERSGMPPWWAAVPCGLYVLMTSIRLARFNGTTPKRPGWYQGVPSTVSGALIASCVILLVRYENSLPLVTLAPYLLVVLLALGLAMVSNAPFARPRATSSRLLNTLLLANVLGLYLCGMLQVWPEYLLGMTVLILLSGLAAGFRRSLPA
jgi:CDP-diacylglycerol--serine O-phosphatidyltransferase